MPLSPDRQKRLLAFLGTLPNGAAGKLFAALERDRHSGGRDLPHDLLLESLRKQLVERDGPFPARALTAQRLFFTPIEDFFIAFRSGKKRRARIARSSIRPIWSLIETDPALTGAARAALALDAAIRDRSSNIDAFEDALFKTAEEGFGKLLQHGDADAAYRADLAERLGGAPALHDLVEIHLLLAGVDHLKAMQRAFPRPVAPLTEEELFEARRLYAAARKETPDVAPYLLLGLMGRMDEPWRALGLYFHLAGARDEGVGPAKNEASVIIEALFEDLESAARALAADAEGELDAEDAGLRVAHFADFAEGLAREARRAGDNVVLNRIEACRDIAADSLARFTEQSLAALRKAMPVRHAGGSSRLAALRPDYSRPLSPRAAAAAREAASFLARADAISKRLGRGPAADGVVREAIDEARRYANDVVVEIRAAEGEDRVAARRLMDHALALAAPLLPDHEVDLLRERAQAASLTA
ncbi:MAG: hypothetical protein WD076_07960 [Parvularculaceae bacterium]